MANLEGKVAWVTGSSRGIGRAIALRLARDGADIAIHGRSDAGPSRAAAEEAAEAVRGLGRRAICVAGDIARKDDVGAAAEQIEAELGRLDPEIEQAAAGYLEGVKSAMRQALLAADEQNELRPGTTPDSAAELLLAVFQGVAVTSKAAPDPERAQSIAREVFRLLRRDPSMVEREARARPVRTPPFLPIH